MPKRRTLATGIYSDAFGLSVIYRGADGLPVETRFPRGSAIDRLTKWRTHQIEQREATTPRTPRRTFARDVIRFLKRLKGLPSYASEKAHLRAWVARFGDRPRRTLRQEHIELAIAEWRTAGYSARTIRHRCRVLLSLYRRLDGRLAPTPLDEIVLPPKTKPRAATVGDDRIAAVALELRKHEIAGTLRSAKTRARFLVQATTGRRPAEIQRTRPEDLDLARRTWLTRTAKGGPNNEMLLNEEQLAAWTLFARAGAWGAYDSRSFVRTLQRCGWPKGIRPYNVRHATAQAIRRRGGDAADVQDQLGHASITTAREFYYTTDAARQAAVSSLLDERFGVSPFVEYTAPTLPSQRRKMGGRRKRSNHSTT